MRIHYDGLRYHASVNGTKTGSFVTKLEADNANNRYVFKRGKK